MDDSTRQCLDGLTKTCQALLDMINAQGEMVHILKNRVTFLEGAVCGILDNQSATRTKAREQRDQLLRIAGYSEPEVPQPDKLPPSGEL